MNHFKKIISLLTISTAIILIGCGSDGGGSDDAVFWATDMQTYESYQVNAPLYKEGKYCKIYVEDESRFLVNDSTLDSVIEEFDNQIYPKTTSKFGEESDVDGNGKIILLILDIRDGFNGTGGYVAGYFDSANTLSKSLFNPYSNESDMIYLDCYPADPMTIDFQMTVAHEFQHLINFTQKGLSDGIYQDTWINEGLSSAAEYIYSGSHLSDRISYYNTYQSTYSWGDNFYKWDNELIDYSTVYLFFQWMRIHSDDGDAIYKDILDSSYTDYNAVVEQIKAHSSLYSSISISKSSWTQIMVDWLIANQINKTSGKLGYNGEITGLTKMTSSNDSGGYTAAFPYEGMIKSITADYTPAAGSGTNIIYRAFNSDGTIDNTSPYGDALSGTKYVLALNTNTNSSGTFEIVILPASIKSEILRSSAEIEPQIYRIDILPGQTTLPSKDKDAERRKILESLK